MPSSNDVFHRLGPITRHGLVACLISTGCSPLPSLSQSAPPAAATECSVGGGGKLAPEDADAVAALRRTVEKSPLYEASAGKRGVASCTVTSESGERIVNYTFRDGGWMRVTYQPRIEYTDQEVRLTSPLEEDSVPVLTRAERAAFGADGCGIDWRQTETRTPEDDANARETIYRGDVCNCQARVRTDAAGRVTGLLFRSAC